MQSACSIIQIDKSPVETLSVNFKILLLCCIKVSAMICLKYFENTFNTEIYAVLLKAFKSSNIPYHCIHKFKSFFK